MENGDIHFHAEVKCAKMLTDGEINVTLILPETEAGAFFAIQMCKAQKTALEINAKPYETVLEKKQRDMRKGGWYRQKLVPNPERVPETD